MRRIARHIRTRCASKAESGQAMVEFAMVVPILLLIVFAAIEFGSAFWTYQQVSASASEGARRAIVSRTDPARDATIETAVQNAAPNLDAAEMSIDTDSTWNPGDTVSVTVSYPDEITILGVTFFDGDLTSTRTMRVEQ